MTALFAGAAGGLTANVTALIFGYSFWMALLCHSLFGFLTMMLVLSLSIVHFGQTFDAHDRKQTS